MKRTQQVLRVPEGPLLWLCYDSSNSNQYDKNYVWWYESETAAKRKIRDHRDNGKANLVGPYLYRAIRPMRLRRGAKNPKVKPDHWVVPPQRDIWVCFNISGEQPPSNYVFCHLSPAKARAWNREEVKKYGRPSPGEPVKYRLVQSFQPAVAARQLRFHRRGGRG